MLMTQKAKQGVMGFSWIIVGLLIISSVIVFGSVNKPTEYQLSMENKIVENPTATPLMSVHASLENVSAARVVMYSDLSVDDLDMTFTLQDQYKQSFELFRSKVFVEKQNYGKAFKKFISDIGFKIDDNGNIVDATSRSVSPSIINCHAMGFFPDRPHIKPNC
jgi:hypothetical protein